MKEHAKGECASSAGLRPFVLLQYTLFLAKTDALRLEAFLKSRKGEAYLRFHLSESMFLAKQIKS